MSDARTTAQGGVLLRCRQHCQISPLLKIDRSGYQVDIDYLMSMQRRLEQRYLVLCQRLSACIADVIGSVDIPDIDIAIPDIAYRDQCEAGQG